MAKSIEIVVRADADQDDCLSAAAASYVEEHPELGGYDLAPRWQDEDDRTLVVLTIPAWAATETSSRQDEIEQHASEAFACASDALKIPANEIEEHLCRFRPIDAGKEWHEKHRLICEELGRLTGYDPDAVGASALLKLRARVLGPLDSDMHEALIAYLEP